MLIFSVSFYAPNLGKGHIIQHCSTRVINSFIKYGGKKWPGL
jgi:hypothetical protein